MGVAVHLHKLIEQNKRKRKNHKCYHFIKPLSVALSRIVKDGIEELQLVDPGEFINLGHHVPIVL